MPSHSEKQREFMGAELARKRAGEKTETGMSEQQLREFASKPVADAANGEEMSEPAGHADWLKQFDHLYQHDPRFEHVRKALSSEHPTG